MCVYLSNESRCVAEKKQTHIQLHDVMQVMELKPILYCRCCKEVSTTDSVTASAAAELSLVLTSAHTGCCGNQ